MSNVDNQIQKLEQEIAELKRQREIEKQNAVEWNPEGGEWYIAEYGAVLRGATKESYANFGVERKSRELALKARDMMRAYNRMLAYVHEHAPEYDATVGIDRATAVFKSDGQWGVVTLAHGGHPFAVYMPKRVARKLAEDLNSGRVKL